MKYYNYYKPHGTTILTKYNKSKNKEKELLVHKRFFSLILTLFSAETVPS